MFETPFTFKNDFAGVAKAPKPLANLLRSRFDGLRGSLKSLLGTMAILGCAGVSFGDGLPGKMKVITERDGGRTRFLVRNFETTDMTATLEIAPVNMKPNVPLPCTVTVPAGKTVEVVTLTPTTGRDADWSFNY